MQGSILDFLKDVILPAEISGKRVIEVGSMDVNGSPRPLFTVHSPREYIGVDFREGPGVDKVCNADNLVATFGPASFEVVVSTEMLEHTPNWKASVFNMKQVLAPEGLLFITTRSPGFEYHGYPHDYWRFTQQHFRAIFRDMQIEALSDDPFKPGVFIKARKPKDFAPADLSIIEVLPAPPNPSQPRAVSGPKSPAPSGRILKRNRIQKRGRR